MKRIKETSDSNYLFVIRTMLGIIFIMTGTMKLTMAEFGNAWSIQLIEAEIPFYTLNYYLVPIFELLLGIVLVAGFYTRVASVMLIPIMLVAIYVHAVVTNPAAFPAQPQAPIIPIVIIILAVIMIKKGAGKLSLDRKFLKSIQ